MSRERQLEEALREMQARVRRRDRLIERMMVALKDGKSIEYLKVLIEDTYSLEAR